MKLQRQILIRIGVLLVRQRNVQPHRRAFARVRALVCRFHNAWPAAREHGKTRIRQPPRHALRQCVFGRGDGQAGAAENADGRGNIGQTGIGDLPFLGDLREWAGHNGAHGKKGAL